MSEAERRGGDGAAERRKREEAMDLKRLKQTGESIRGLLPFHRGALRSALVRAWAKKGGQGLKNAPNRGKGETRAGDPRTLWDGIDFASQYCVRA